MRNERIPRFVGLFFGEFRGLIKLNLLFLLCALPTVGLFILGFLGFFSGAALALSIIAAYPIGGAVTAYFFSLTRMLRDVPGFIWHDFRRKFLENVKQSAAPGIMCTAFIYMQVYLWGPFLFGGAGIDPGWLITGIVFLLIFGMVTPYIFLQIAYVDLRMRQIIMNSVLIAFANAPHSIMGAISGSVIWVAFILFFPDSLVFAPLLALIGFSLSGLLCIVWVWPSVNKQFKIEETLRNRGLPEEASLRNETGLN